MAKGEITPWVDPEEPVEAELLNSDNGLVIYKGAKVVGKFGRYEFVEHEFRVIPGKDDTFFVDGLAPALEALTHREIEGTKE